ncbi:glycosyltransferase [Paraferrimonas sedimenticola]|uniref:Glycosyl transferase family 1 domain-containing protein n=1 Tax=Paraferrimonas sedimenticola TaxID=375674 RepID=A0AA37W1G6_9GAMM|nr:glycosyltransferase [Paraferrimonas sedimenticola]GLP96763.1 hypothetical protein GCM10007895_20690 [Paraferrimonas sedimenticola]
MYRLGKQRVFVDASNIKVGGGVQVALSFISHTLKVEYKEFEFFYLVSSNVAKELPPEFFNKEHLVLTTGVKTLVPLSKDRYRIRSCINSFKPHVVFTIFGPCFWGTSKNHVVGFANAWLVRPDSSAYFEYSPFKRFFKKIKNSILLSFLKRNGSNYITETKSMKLALVKYGKVSEDKIVIVPNALPYSYTKNDYINFERMSGSKSDEVGEFKFVTISAPYVHKNLSIIEDVGNVLLERGYNFKFLVTFTEEEYECFSCRFKLHTTNLGRLTVEECKEHYSSADAMFLPTLLESFSVSYLEAMACHTPICTSDLSFARDVCGDAALYFDARDPIDIAGKLALLMDDRTLADQLVENGRKRLSYHIDNDERAKRYLNYIKGFGVN